MSKDFELTEYSMELFECIWMPLVLMHDLGFTGLYTTATDSLHEAKDVTAHTYTHRLAYTHVNVHTR